MSRQTLHKPKIKPGGRSKGQWYTGNRFGLMEWSGAFGDLGTLVPFVLVYISIAGLDPSGVMFVFGVTLIGCGFYYRTPFPVQPMKLIAAVVATQALQLSIDASTIFAAGLITGLIWLLLGLSGGVERIGRLVERPVLSGMIIGLGAGFMLQGAEMMLEHLLLALTGGGIALLLLINRAIPVMLLLLLFGLMSGWWLSPQAVEHSVSAGMTISWPNFTLRQIGAADLVTATLFLVLPQIPLTLSNAVLSIREENNRLFPDRPVTVRKVALSTGLVNLFGASFGGVPMCHGAGGMAGHVVFGARTGGASIVLGSLLLAGGLLFSETLAQWMRLFPAALLGVVLFIAGLQLCLGTGRLGTERWQRWLTLLVALVALWHVGVAFVIGLIATQMHRRGWVFR